MSSLSVCRHCLRQQYQHVRARISQQHHQLSSRRAASSTTSGNGNGKPIVLEQPDKFRPPSHPARLNRPRRSPAAYNQEPTAKERQQQQKKSYPHMFPGRGTFMHWFLTDRKIHFYITMGTLTTLACITMTQSFLHTSPYAHLLPSISSFPLHPITYIKDVLSVLKLNMDYETERANTSRQNKILDAQKRRLYRRAHGLENLDADEDQGIDVRGLVPWDDGLTNKERESGSGRETILTMADMVRLGMRPGESPLEFTKRLESDKARMTRIRTVGVEATLKEEAALTGKRLDDDLELIERENARLAQESEGPQPERRKRKLWLGIW